MVAGKAIEKDEPARVAELVRQQAAIGDVDAIITTGGTGLTSRDSTFEAIDALLTKRLPGFGELFRMLSYQDIGSAAMMSRACAGTIGRIVVISLAGFREGGQARDGQARHSRARAPRAAGNEVIRRSGYNPRR